MTTTWIVVALVGVGTVAIKATGPVLLGGRRLPARVSAVIELLAPALLAALVVTQTLGSGRHLQIDARLLGVAVAGMALWRKTPVLVVIAAAAAATAVGRLLV